MVKDAGKSFFPITITHLSFRGKEYGNIRSDKKETKNNKNVFIYFLFSNTNNSSQVSVSFLKEIICFYQKMKTKVNDEKKNIFNR